MCLMRRFVMHLLLVRLEMMQRSILNKTALKCTSTPNLRFLNVGKETLRWLILNKFLKCAKFA